MTTILKEKLEDGLPEVLDHLEENCLEIDATFTPHFMTLFVYLTPIEIATRLIEIFILHGDMALVDILYRMMELKQDELLRREDTSLQRYVLSEMIVECV